MERNKNFDTAFVGGRGDGKSWGSMTLGCSCSLLFKTRFNVDENIHFYGDDFIDQLHKVVKNKQPRDIKPGYVMIIDEAGRGLDAQRWWDKHIKVVADEMETYRTYRMVVIVSTPYIANITKRARGLFHGYFKPLLPPVKDRKELVGPTSNVKKSINESWWKFHKLWRDPAPVRNKDIQYHYRLWDNQGYLERVRVGIPPKLIIKDYEIKKHEYLDDARGEYVDSEIDVTEINTFQTFEDAVRENLDKYKITTKSGKEKISNDLIMRDVRLKILPDIGRDDVRAIKAGLEVELNGT